MISSGGTIAAASRLLKENQAKEIFVFATHPVFSGNFKEVLEKSNVKKIFVTDTVDIPKEKSFKKLEVLSVAGLIARAL